MGGFGKIRGKTTVPRIVCVLAVTAAFGAGPQARARVVPPTLQRIYEPVVFYGSNLPELAGLPVEAIHAFAYRADSSKWVAIPFQIDEVRDGDYFTSDDGLLDDDDELVFFSGDVGARVPDGVWLPGEGPRANLRIEIEVWNPLDETQRGWVYLFVNAPDSFILRMPHYFDYDATNDRVLGKYYLVGYNNHGTLVDAHITVAGGGQDVDIVDRQKQRVKGNYRVGWITYNYKATEENVEKVGVDIQGGTVRLLRRLRAKLVYLNLIEQDVSLLTRYYPRSFYVGGGGNISAEYGVYHIRQSLDLNANATGMYFLNARNDSVRVDGDQSQDNVDKALDTPAKHWFMVTGSQGTILTLIDVPKIGDVQRLYYRDSDGGTDDGTSDTGDGRSYGDIGVYIYTTGGRVITGPSSTANWVYFLPANQTREVGEAMLENWLNPLRLRIEPQRIDTLPPAGVYDLLASAEGEGEVRLEWTAPGDDQHTGQAERYDIRYSRQPPPVLVSASQAGFTSGDYDLDTWYRDARPIPDTTAPLPAGEHESRLYTGFQVKTRYYFALRAIDDAGHQGPISNIAVVLVVPVELSSFTAQAVADSVVLRWTTESETNNVGFAIERRTGRSEWTQVGFVSGRGTATEGHNYRFADSPRTAGTYEYRLKQIDSDGSVAYSKVLRVDFVPREFAQLLAYPNPFNAQTRIHLRLPGAKRATLAIYDALGRRVKSIELPSTDAGRFEFVWDGTNDRNEQVASGIYVVRARGGGRLLNTKILLVR